MVWARTRRYEQQPTGIAPERVKGMAMDLSKTDTREYILRPEALESFWCALHFARIPTHTHTHMRARMHTHARARTHTHTPTHTVHYTTE